MSRSAPLRIRRLTRIRHFGLPLMVAACAAQLASCGTADDRAMAGSDAKRIAAPVIGTVGTDSPMLGRDHSPVRTTPAPHGAAVPKPASGYYIFATFAPATSTMHLLRSSDLKRWTELAPGHVYADPEGFAVGVHDPSIMKYRNGIYYVAYTTSRPGSFAIAISRNLIDWRFLTRVSTADIRGVAHSWAPEWFIDRDGSVHVFFSANTISATNAGFALYEIHPLRSDGLGGRWSLPRRIVGTGLPSNIIDPFVVRIGATYYIWYANGSRGGSGGTIEMMRSDRLTQGYQVVRSGNWSGWGAGIDGPALIRTGKHRWLLCFEDASYASQERCASSTDDFATFSSAVPVIAPMRVQHGTILAVDRLPTAR